MRYVAVRNFRKRISRLDSSTKKQISYLSWVDGSSIYSSLSSFIWSVNFSTIRTNSIGATTYKNMLIFKEYL